ncbi:MAG: DUF3486 family protein [Ruminococcus sp.]|nr:DUF3486 family protein [Ruminococcus sp.]
MGKHTRKHYAIDKLPLDVKETVNEMIKADFTYKEIVDYIKKSGNSISLSAVQRYAANLMQSIQSIRMTQENFRAIMDETIDYDHIDFIEPLTRLLCGLLLEQISNLSHEQLQELEVNTLIKNTIALTRAVAYKKNMDIKNKSALENGLGEFTATLFETMRIDKPRLYSQVMKYIESQG